LGAEFFRADEQTDGRTDERTEMTKLVVAFRNGAKELKGNFQM